MRMTFDYPQNEQKMSEHAAKILNDLAKPMQPTHHIPATARNSWTADAIKNRYLRNPGLLV